MLNCGYNRLAYLIKNTKDLQADKVLILPYLHERRIHLNRRADSNQFYTIAEYEDKKFILCMCIDDDKLYVYTETGILVRRITYSDLSEDYGRPQAISEDGKNVLFTKSRTSPIIALIKMDIEGMHLKSEVNYVQRIGAHI